jgi:hypothetical protein
MMKDEFREIARELNSASQDYLRMRFMTRAKELQSAAIDRLTALRGRVSKFKAETVSTGQEDCANLLLGFELLIDALTAELKMCLALKEDCMSAAWDYLVDAQSAAHQCLLAHDGIEGVEQLLEHLYALEPMLFPPIQFCSVGMIVKKALCSICSEKYSACEHIAGRPYMGQLCARVIVDVSMTEVSLVETPANKHARITQIGDSGGMRDVLTWRIVDDAEPRAGVKSGGESGTVGE